MTLTPEQLILIGLVATVAAYLLRLLAIQLFKTKIDRDWVTGIAFVLSLILSVLWMLPTLPPVVDFGSLVAVLVDKAAAVLGFATIIYNVLLERILQKLNVDVDSLLAKRTG